MSLKTYRVQRRAAEPSFREWTRFCFDHALENTTTSPYVTYDHKFLFLKSQISSNQVTLMMACAALVSPELKLEKFRRVRITWKRLQRLHRITSKTYYVCKVRFPTEAWKGCEKAAATLQVVAISGKFSVLPTRHVSRWQNVVDFQWFLWICDDNFHQPCTQNAGSMPGPQAAWVVGVWCPHAAVKDSAHPVVSFEV